MKETSEDVVACFRELREFCENVGALLTEANELMKGAGWEHIWKFTPVIQVCTKLDDDATCWLPDTFFCYYENNDSHLLPFIAVLVDDLYADDYDPDRVTEPLITAGWLGYPSGTNAKDEWDKDYGVHYSHLWMKDRRDDGTFCSGEARDVWEDDETEAGVTISTFAVPLDQIESSDDLEEKVVRPLLDRIGKSS